MIRLLLDQGIPRDAAALLRQSGVDCIHVGEIGMSRAADGDILARARDEKAIAVTLDADFHAILAVTLATTPSVIRIRLQGLSADALVTLVQETLATHGVELTQGAMVTVKERKTTCRRLPVRLRE